MKLLRVIMLLSAGILANMHAAVDYSVQLINRTDYRIKATVATATVGFSQDMDVKGEDRGDVDQIVRLGGNCPKWIKFEFYNKNGKKVSAKHVAKKLEGAKHSLSGGQLYHSLGWGWGTFRCTSLVITFEELAGGKIEFTVEDRAPKDV